MRIVFFSHSGALGGAERVLLETVEVLVEQGHYCHVILPSSREFAAELTSRGIHFSILQSRSVVTWGRTSLSTRLKSFLWTLIRILPTMRTIWKLKPGLVYSNTVTIFHGAIAAKLLGVPHLWHIHEFGEEDHGIDFDFGQPVARFLFQKLSDQCIAVSQALADKYRQFIDSEKIAVIYPLMQSSQSSDVQTDMGSAALFANPGAFQCVQVGGLSVGKRQRDAVLAISELARQGKFASLTLVGGGPEETRSELRALAERGGAQTKVAFTGLVADAAPYIRAADALLVCSRSEAFGRVTVEAMQAARPVIGSRSGATPELVQDQFNGLLYDPGDINDLTRCIAYLMEHPDRAREMGKNGQLWSAKIFTKERYAAELGSCLAAFRESNSGLSSSE